MDKMILEDKLAEEIGEILIEREIVIKEPKDSDKRHRGWEWLKNNKKKICAIIKKPAVQRLINSQDSQEEQFRALLDIISSATFGIPPTLLAKAILLLGESWFCEE
jgi:hypothetical protein